MNESIPHAYREQSAFDRLLLLIATLVQCPGVGRPDAADNSRSITESSDSFESIRVQMQAIAKTYGIDLPNYSAHTLRKDLKTLRQYGILDHRMYRWGYYLGTGALNREELQAALQALIAQAKSQGNPNVRRIVETLEQRLRGLNLELHGQLFYPVRTQLDRAIVYADPDEMMHQGKYRQTLFHQITAVEAAIASGQAIEILCQSNPYAKNATGYIKVHPLQLIYAEIAWYLLYEVYEQPFLVIRRVDRLSDYCQPIAGSNRSLLMQKESLEAAHKLLTNGWGLFLGEPHEQRQERAGKLELIDVWVRFFPPVTDFILEGDRRHPTQKVKRHAHGKEVYVDYQVQLPRRSLNEFCYWVHRFMNHAQFVAPQFLVDQHHQAALNLVQRYSENLP
jgi:hypothetical protein